MPATLHLQASEVRRRRVSSLLHYQQTIPEHYENRPGLLTRELKEVSNKPPLFFGFLRASAFPIKVLKRVEALAPRDSWMHGVPYTNIMRTTYVLNDKLCR